MHRAVLLGWYSPSPCPLDLEPPLERLTKGLVLLHLQAMKSIPSAAQFPSSVAEALEIKVSSL